MTSGPVTTVTITPSSSNCTLSEGGIIGGGGGGGGGGAPTPVYTVIPGTASSASSVSSAASSATAIAQAPSTAKTITTPWRNPHFARALQGRHHHHQIAQTRLARQRSQSFAASSCPRQDYLSGGSSHWLLRTGHPKSHHPIPKEIRH